jgi:DNA-binding XRE family transcriptional regulator
MIKTDELRGIIAREKTTQKAVAKACGISEKTFQRKMEKGIFGSDEIEVMITLLNIEDPVSIFFAK